MDSESNVISDKEDEDGFTLVKKEKHSGVLDFNSSTKTVKYIDKNQ